LRVPFTRGKERSRASDLFSKKRARADLGYTEIQLLGQNVNSYKDSAGKQSFAELLAAVGEVRASGGCASPPRIPATLDATLSKPSRPCLLSAINVHLPVQSGSNRVLDAMQRLYTRDQYLETHSPG